MTSPEKMENCESHDDGIEPGFVLSFDSWKAFATTPHDDIGGRCPLDVLKVAPEELSRTYGGKFAGLISEAESSQALVAALLGQALTGKFEIAVNWWRTTGRYRYCRVTLLAYMICFSRKGRDDYPPAKSYSRRFAEPEASQRLEEVDLVERNFRAFGRQIHEFISQNPSEERIVRVLKEAFGIYAQK